MTIKAIDIGEIRVPKQSEPRMVIHLMLLEGKLNKQIKSLKLCRVI